MNAECIFCSIVDKKLPAKIIEESDNLLVIEDIAPKAPIHYLLVPKKHICSIATLQSDDASVMQELLFCAQDLSKKLSGSQAFRLVFNSGADAGQSVFHLHGHFLSGKTMHDL